MNPSASSLERARACPASEALPRTNSTSEMAERGTAIHLFVRRVLKGMSLPRALSLVPNDWRQTCERIDFAKISGDLSEVCSEHSYALNCVTGEARIIGEDIGRRYPDLGPDWFVGTEDVSGVDLTGKPVTGDIKSGFADVTDPEDNLQNKFFGKVHQSLTEADEVEGRIIRIDEAGFVRPISAVYSAFDLDSFGDTLIDIRDGVARARARVAAGEVPTVTEGEHCRYCPAFSACPAKAALVRNMLPELDDLRGRIAMMTLEERGKAWAKYKQIKPVFEAVESALKEAAAVDSLPLPNGKWVGEISYPKQSFNKARAYALLRELGATDDQISSLTTTIVVDQIRELKRPPRRPYEEANELAANEKKDEGEAA
jgi:hypothetical protein